MRRTKILVIDGEDSVLGAVRDALADAEADIVAETRVDAALESVLAEVPGVVVAAVGALGDDPSTWIARATRSNPSLVAILLAEKGPAPHPAIPEAFDILENPASAAALRRACGRGVEHHRLLDRLHALGGDARDGRRGDEAAAADRRFRDAKRTVVDAFEQAYLEDLLRRHRGNVTAAASHSGMLRSALQRLLRKHDLRSSEFRLERSSGTRERSY